MPSLVCYINVTYLYLKETIPLMIGIPNRTYKSCRYWRQPQTDSIMITPCVTCVAKAASMLGWSSITLMLGSIRNLSTRPGPWSRRGLLPKRPYLPHFGGTSLEDQFMLLTTQKTRIQTREPEEQQNCLVGRPGNQVAIRH